METGHPRKGPCCPGSFIHYTATKTAGGSQGPERHGQRKPEVFQMSLCPWYRKSSVRRLHHKFCGWISKQDGRPRRLCLRRESGNDESWDTEQPSCAFQDRRSQGQSSDKVLWAPWNLSELLFTSDASVYPRLSTWGERAAELLLVFFRWEKHVLAY